MSKTLNLHLQISIGTNLCICAIGRYEAVTMSVTIQYNRVIV
jgi:hypothetical protein